jgi:hypothetical protein
MLGLWAFWGLGTMKLDETLDWMRNDDHGIWVFGVWGTLLGID